jgi:hypothetical protein
MRSLLRCLLGAALLIGGAARAEDFEVRSPIIDPEELELDLKAAFGVDRRADRSRERGFVTELEYGVNEWWSPAIEAEWDRAAGPDEPTRLASFTLENRFQLAPEGKYWLDPGLFLEYERSLVGDARDVVRLGPLLRKDVGPTRNVLNLFAVKRLGPPHAGLGYAYAWQTQWQLSDLVQPGLEVYGGSGEGNDAAIQHRGGPVLFGVFRFGEGHDIRYEAGYLLGFNHATPDGTFKLLIGYEYQF